MSNSQEPHSPMYRMSLPLVAFTWLVMFTWPLFLSGELMTNLWSILWMLASVIGLGLLTWGVGKAAFSLLRANVGSSWKKMLLTWAAFVAGFGFIGFMTVTFVMDVSLGAGLRSMALFSILPQGNLLWAGGITSMISLTYLVISLVMIGSLLWGWLMAVPGRFVAALKDAVTRQETEDNGVQRNVPPALVSRTATMPVRQPVRPSIYERLEKPQYGGVEDLEAMAQ